MKNSNTKNSLPKFDIKASELKNKVLGAISNINAESSAAKKVDNPVWSTFSKMDDALEVLSLLLSEVSHLKSVTDRKDLEDAYNEIIPELSKLHADFGQDRDLFNSYTSVFNSDITNTQKRILTSILDNFKVSGLDLVIEDQTKLNKINERLTFLGQTYIQNIQRSTDSWSLLIEDVRDLDGVPESAILRFRSQAVDAGKSGYLITLQMPDYIAILENANVRAIREEVYHGRAYLASDLSNNGDYDNHPIFTEILKLKDEKAKLLGFDTFADLSLNDKMAKSPKDVIDFLNNIKDKAKSQGIRETNELKEFASLKKYIDFQNWDNMYYSEKLKEDKYNVNSKEIKQYFQVKKSVSGLFWLINELFDIVITEIEAPNSYHEDLKLYKLEKNGSLIAHIYTDLYARSGKRSGAWMNNYKSKSVDSLPIAFVSCNFEKSVDDSPSLLSFDELQILFHEFGHAIHHALTVVDDSAASGINGVPWDAVEVPSTLMEFFCLNDIVIDKISENHLTKNKLPLELKEKLIKSKNFLSARSMLRQLELSLTDISIYSGNTEDPYKIMNDIRVELGFDRMGEDNRFLNNFPHIFAGGYAAGYYSYKWSDILSADIFKTFEENGVICKDTASRFLDLYLSQGSSKDVNDMFVDFKGREPSVDAFLNYNGIL